MRLVGTTNTVYTQVSECAQITAGRGLRAVPPGVGETRHGLSIHPGPPGDPRRRPLRHDRSWFLLRGLGFRLHDDERSRASGPRRTGAIHDTQDRYSIPTSSKHAIFISLNELTGTVNGPREVDNVPDNCTDSDTETDPSPVRPTGTPGIRDPGSGGARALGFVCDTRFIK